MSELASPVCVESVSIRPGPQVVVYVQGVISPCRNVNYAGRVKGAEESVLCFQLDPMAVWPARQVTSIVLASALFSYCSPPQEASTFNDTLILAMLKSSGG